MKWKSGDIITAEKLNKMKPFIIHYDYSNDFIDVSYQDIKNALEDNRFVLLFIATQEGISIDYLIGTNQTSYEYMVSFNWIDFRASTKDEKMGIEGEFS